MKTKNTAKLNWWYKYTDVKQYFGGDDHRYFSLHLHPLNGGHNLDFTFLLNKDLDMAGTIDQGYLQLMDTNDKTYKKHIFELGDIPFSSLVTFAICILKIFKPELLNEAEVKKNI